MTQCEHYPAHENNQYGNCQGKVNKCVKTNHDHYICEKHYYTLDHMRSIGEK